MTLTQEVTSVELRVAVLFRKNLFKCSLQHAVLAGVTEALMSLAELWMKLFGTVELQLLPAEPLKYGRNRRFIWMSWLKTVGQCVYLHPGLCFFMILYSNLLTLVAFPLLWLISQAVIGGCRDGWHHCYVCFCSWLHLSFQSRIFLGKVPNTFIA